MRKTLKIIFTPLLYRPLGKDSAMLWTGHITVHPEVRQMDKTGNMMDWNIYIYPNNRSNEGLPNMLCTLLVVRRHNMANCDWNCSKGSQLINERGIPAWCTACQKILASPFKGCAWCSLFYWHNSVIFEAGMKAKAFHVFMPCRAVMPRGHAW